MTEQQKKAKFRAWWLSTGSPAPKAWTKILADHRAVLQAESRAAELRAQYDIDCGEANKYDQQEQAFLAAISD